jgi:uncharacterized protein (TIGR03066 family)
MKSLIAIAVGMALIGLTARGVADEPKKDEVIAKLLGKWEITKADDENLVGGVIEFEKDGNFTFSKDGNEGKGTYKIDDKGKLITSIGDSSDTDTIKKLTSDTMELENKDGKATSLKKKK